MRKYKYNTTTKYILYIVAITILFSLMITIDNSHINDNNVSALDYSSNVGIGFTFNPTLSVSISPSDLIIDNLIPGNTLDSNSINVSVATNAAYGYTLSANVNDENLVHSNNIDIFSSIDANADLASLDTDNTWGYTSKLSNETAWSNYNGLSSSSNTILLDNNNISDSVNSIDFKIAAKASDTQSSGVYTGTINFYAITKPTPITLSEAYASDGKTMINGYYTMQDMTSTICDKTEAIGAQLQVLDIRDNKLYWISKLADNHCWMTQNLDLDLSPDRPLTSKDTDLNDGSLSGIYSVVAGYNYDVKSNKISWVPKYSTIDFANTSISGWIFAGNIAGSANKVDDAMHGHQSLGNYYNWSAAIASNDSAGVVGGDIMNSICAKNWRLPNNSNRDFATLINIYNGSASNDVKLIVGPLWFVRGGYILVTSLDDFPDSGGYWTNTPSSRDYAYRLSFSEREANPAKTNGGKGLGFFVRCLAR